MTYNTLQQNMNVKKVKYYTIELVNQNPNCLFIFGSNLIGRGMGGQAIIRHCKNAHGIPTKKLPSNTPKSFFTDREFEKNKEIIKNAIDSIDSIGSSYDTIVFPEDGLGTGLAELPTRAPNTYNFMVDYINSKFGNVY